MWNPDGGARMKYNRVRKFGDSLVTYYELPGTLIDYDFASGERMEWAVRFIAEDEARIESLLAGAFARDAESVKTPADRYYHENDLTRLPGFLSFIASETRAEASGRGEIARDMGVRADGSAGRAIYDLSKKDVLGRGRRG
jgi:hypothetical protein